MYTYLNWVYFNNFVVIVSDVHQIYCGSICVCHFESMRDPNILLVVPT